MTKVISLGNRGRRVVDLSSGAGWVCVPKNGDRMAGTASVSDVIADAVILRYEDGTEVTLAHL